MTQSNNQDASPAISQDVERSPLGLLSRRPSAGVGGCQKGILRVAKRRGGLSAHCSEIIVLDAVMGPAPTER